MSEKNGRNSPCKCGSGKKYKHCCLPTDELAQAAQSKVRNADEPLPELLSQAIELFTQGRNDAATAACKKIIGLTPSQPDALHLLGLIAHRQGRQQDALQHIDRAIAVAPSNDTMHSNRGIVLQVLGRHEEALRAFQQSLILDPLNVAALTHKGLSHIALGQFDVAEQSLLAGLRIAPTNVAALSALGQCFLMSNRFADAVTYLERACAADSRFPGARTNLGVARWAMGQHEQALNDFRQVIAIAPDRADGWDRLGGVLQEMGDSEDAQGAFARAYQLEPQPTRLLRKSLILRHVHDSLESMTQERQRFESKLDELLASVSDPAEPDVSAFLPSIFSLAYHGTDMLPIMRKLAALYAAMYPGLAWRAPHVDNPARQGSRIRVGFFTSYLHDHPVAHCFAPLMHALVGDEACEVFLISARPLPVSGRRPYEGYGGSFVRVSDKISEARKTIAELELDVLVYQDIGMEALSYFLGFARLARHQCVLGGHPVTTGLPEIDHHVSSSLGEPSDAQAHYSENLVLFDTMTVLWERPELPVRLKSRAELGLPLEGRLYICPVMLQKVHPDFDFAVAGILSADPGGYVVFFKHASLPLDRQLQRRFERTIAPELRERILFLPWVRDKDDFASINALASVILDPFHFGIGSTAITTMAVATPFVTMPAKFLRGRVGLMFARTMGVEDCVASSAEDYVRKAVQVATDTALRTDLSQRIRDSGSRFFLNQVYLKEMRRFLRAFSAGSPNCAIEVLRENPA